MEKRPRENAVYVTGLSMDVSDEELAGLFGSIGVIKHDKRNNRQMVNMYKNKMTGEFKGEAMITYDDPQAAKTAIEWFNDKEFFGKKIHVEQATYLVPVDGFRRGRYPGRGRGIYCGGRGGFHGVGRKAVAPETQPPESEYDFVEEPSQDMFCPVTFEVLRDPHQTTCCGHHISATAGARLQREGKPCPMCKEPNFETQTDKYFKRVVNDLKVRCPHKGSGCEWMGDLGNLDYHAKLCPKRPWQCQYCDFTATYDVGADEHLPQCPKFPEPCPNGCEAGTVERCDLERHLATECPLQLVACEFSHAGCTEKVLRKDLAGHMVESVQKHLLTMSLLNLSLTRELHENLGEKDRQIAELQLQLKQLDGKVDRKFQQLDGKVNQKLQQLDGKVDQKFQQLDGKVDQKFQQLDGKVKQQFQDLVGSVHTEEFTLTEFGQWKAQRKGNWLSEPFYSYVQGYKFKFNIDFDTSHMRIYLYLLKGEHDDTLSWPIKCIASIWIMNQERGKKHIGKNSSWEWNSAPEHI